MIRSIRPFARVGLLAFLWLATLTACETTKRSFPEVNAPDDPNATSRHQLEATSKQIAQANDSDGKVKFIVPREQLSLAFIRQFNDGTVIDKTVIRKVQEGKEAPVYYLVGMGLRDGMFRAMAIPLQTSTDNSLYLASNAARYIITGVGCTFCFFNFEKNQIVGTTCEENTGGSSCDLRVVDNNNLFQRR
ncbi:hypothetical protein [Hymenobacter sp. BT491]|uniref:hypothetical protein n=1 Tax=Hymenobacter sp. BT491 TaxID=2766779 RepID=UPI001653C6DC|nr:hypothetical protein [Hymenobacter sp. BT491]MBC6989492.1 hypothetical protein [Hymenobacter sp. BT491]